MRKVHYFCILTLFIGLVFSFNTFAAKKKKKRPVVVATPSNSLKTKIDTLNYALGGNLSRFLERQIAVPVDLLNLDIIIQGIRDVANKQELLSARMGDSLLILAETKQKQKIIDQEKKYAMNFLEQNKKEEGVIVTASGLQYKVEREGVGEKPTAKNTVKVHYRGSLVDGTVFDSSYERGTPAEFPLGNVIQGWVEGIQLMSPGGKYTFFIPADLGYGEAGAGEVIPPNSVLVFTVELLEVL